MNRLLSLLLLGSALVASVACGSATSSVGAKPPAPDGRQSRVRPQRPRAPPVLIAPPPAYGNKIVMARGSHGTVTN